MRELAFHNWLQANSDSRCGILKGIGDDCAVIPLGHAGDRRFLLFTTDTIVGGVDFHCPALGTPNSAAGRLNPRQVGRKALAVSLSDIAAMGGRPLCAVVSLALPRAASLDTVRALYRGLEQIAADFRTAVVGGDFSTSPGPTVITTSVLGSAEGAAPVSRAGARPGDVIFVTGSLGGSILHKHWAFTPRIAEGAVLRTMFRASAMMDISDGLALDLWRLTKMSGVGATIYEERIPISQHTKTLARRSGRAPLDHALHDGEDFELLFAMRPLMAEKLTRTKRLQTKVTAIGKIEAARGLRIMRRSGQVCALEPQGYEH
jgi:thiamine-monophosphate kinase